MKTITEINDRIWQGRAVVLTATEAKNLAAETSVKELARRADVVTTATFSPMCSSGVFLNLGHTTPPMKMQRVTLDGVPAYGGVAAVDLFLGATEERPGDPRFGGAHVISRLVRGESVELVADGRPTDCYPRSRVTGRFRLADINQAYFFNPRNCYQNYAAATNSSDRTLYTYMGRLEPGFGSVNFSGSGELSPLMNDPELRCVGIGTRIFFCGGTGYVSWEGTQFNGDQRRDPATGLPVGPAATLAVTADLRGVRPEYVRPVVIPGYGISLYVAIGLAVPVLDEAMAVHLARRDHDLRTRVVDYASGEVVREIRYDELFSGRVEVAGRQAVTRTMSSRRRALGITRTLKEWIAAGSFELTAPVAPLPLWGRQGTFGGETP